MTSKHYYVEAKENFIQTVVNAFKCSHFLDFKYQGGPKNKTPWIEYNGIAMGDSQLIIEYFNKKFDIDMNSHLKYTYWYVYKQERATAWAIQKWLEEYTYWYVYKQERATAWAIQKWLEEYTYWYVYKQERATAWAIQKWLEEYTYWYVYKQERATAWAIQKWLEEYTYWYVYKQERATAWAIQKWLEEYTYWYVYKQERATAWAIEKWLEEYTYWYVYKQERATAWAIEKWLEEYTYWYVYKQERATAWAIQKWLEEYTYWLNVHTRWYIFWDDMFTKILNVPRFVTAISKVVRRPKMYKDLYTVGVARHSDEEIHEMMIKDVKHFSEILGDKKYIMGDKITETDCAAFGVLSQIRWCTPESCPGHQLLTSGELKNVTDYLDRIKDTYWLDWEEILAAVKK
ncbi:uncharacterized protein LOC123540858 [Mercenaria mercenaria]|uniref:uncharacterized protein LOC123540858 n=1 Tax=Mercenaria mercenaria TaxID=6596 RepID=UPI00234EDEE0|nr:uncharacterized protein LOC123540858 [Mercenaria mercenaria]